MSYSNINNPVNYQLQGFGQNGVRTISTDQLYIQGEYYRVLVAEEDSYVTAVSVLGDDLTAEFVYAGTTIYGLFTEVSVTSGSLTAYIAGPTDIDDVWAYINEYGLTNGATIEAADCSKDAIAPLLDKYYAKASLVMVPSLYKTSIVYSERPLTTDGQLAFTRSNDTATRVGPDGYIEKVRTNLVLQSETFQTTWSPVNSSISVDSTTAPNGTLTADKLLAAVSVSDQHRIDQTPTTAAGSNTFSVYAKKGEIEFLFLRIGLAGAYFNLNDGSVGSVSAGIVASSVDAGNGWYRCIITKTAAIANEVVRINLATAFGVNNFIGNGTDGAFIWGAQYELNDIATNYIPTTTTAVSVGPVANLPRLNYPINSDGSVGCPSLLLEPQRTNLAQFSESFDNAYWTKDASTVTANFAISPDGYTNADKLFETATTDFHRVYGPTISVTSGTTYTASIFVKAAEVTTFAIEMRLTSNVADATFDLVAGTVTGSGTIEDYGNGWYRCIVTGTATATGGGRPMFFIKQRSSYAGNTSNGLLIYGAQFEVGAYATSYIPTLGASVTRGADACSKTGISSLIGQTEGTLFLEVDAVNFETDQRFAISDGTAANRIALRMSTGGVIQLSVVIGSTTQASISGIGSVGNTYKIAGAYKANDFVLYINGSLVNTDTSGSVSGTFSRLATDNGLSGQDFYNPIKQALLFKTRLTNQELQDLTTL